MPSIAVVIPVGPGHEQIAKRAVWSVLRQTVPAVAVIANDTPLHFISTGHSLQTKTSAEGRQGVGTARRAGTELAAGLYGFDFICYLDADDILMPRAIESMLRALAANPGAAYAYGDGYNLRGGDATYYRAAEYDRAIYGRQNIHNVTALMPTSVALAGEWTNKHWEDYLFYCSLAIKGHCGVRAPYPVIAYDLAAGYRRELAFGEGSDYALGLAAEYRQRFEQEATMGCCGNPGTVTLDAATMIEAVPGVATPAGKIRLAYAGTNLGPVPYKTNGRSYRGAAGREVFAHAEDVDFLLRTGRWYEVADVPSADEAVAYVAALDSELGLSTLLADTANESADAVRELAHGMASRRPSDDDYRAAILRDGVRRAEEGALMASLSVQHADLITRLSDDVDEPADPAPEPLPFTPDAPRRRGRKPTGRS